MKVLNIHKRQIKAPITKLGDILSTLASRDDQLWPHEHWPKMKLDKGLIKGSKGGHGPIRYTVKEYVPNSHVIFQFTAPKGFNGTHRLDLTEIDKEHTEIQHIIDMDTSGRAMITWALMIRWLHDALLEDAFDKVQNRLMGTSAKTHWSPWVKFVRYNLK